MKTLSISSLGLVALAFFGGEAAANQWFDVTASELRKGCYASTSSKNSGACLTGDERRRVGGRNQSNCDLFSVNEMITSCKLLQAEVHTRESCDAPVATRTCTEAKACVAAREGVMTYYAGSGVSNLTKAITVWAKNNRANKTLLTVGREIRSAMEDPSIVANHRTALKAAKAVQTELCR